MQRKNSYSQLRIIGGKWRSRKINFLAQSDIRPTPDRVRETLFNWLAPVIQDAICLDAFAGSGALGFEALSRGAQSVVMIDQSAENIRTLQENAKKLTAENIEFYFGRNPEILSSLKNKKFSIVFLDPPFKQNLIEVTAAALEKYQLLAEEAIIYIEAESELTQLSLPENWQIVRNKKAGMVSYYLVKRSLAEI